MDADALARRIRVARGREPGDLLLAGGQVANVFTGRVETADVVVADGVIAGVGPYAWDAAERIDVGGRTVIPALIDAHMHVESTLLVPGELARLVAPRGTGALICDPHEIGNVSGVGGIEALIAASSPLPVDFHYMAPSCVPAVGWEHAGAVLDAGAIERLLQNPGVLGLAEMMNFPGVINADPEVVAKLVAARRWSRILDGHAPGVAGLDLQAYAAAGIRSDHESTEAAEAAAKAGLGMLVQVREGSIARNLDAMLPLMAGDELGGWCLCTDDVHADDLIEHGHIDGLLRRVVAAGVDPVRAVRHCTLVPARHYGLDDRGAVAPGRVADLAVVEDLECFRVMLVLHRGAVVARDGACVDAGAAPPVPADNTVRLPPLDESAFRLEVGAGPVPVIEIVPDQIVTRRGSRSVARSDGAWRFDPADDVALIANIERHGGPGGTGLGLVAGFGFSTHGAIGSSVAHDAHNLIIAGTNPADMLACARALAETGGGFVVCRDGALAARLPLPVAGLLLTEPAARVCERLREVREAAAGLGCRLGCPFGTLSFLALSVIPELRISDRGVFDVVDQAFVEVHS